MEFDGIPMYYDGNPLWLDMYVYVLTSCTYPRMPVNSDLVQSTKVSGPSNFHNSFKLLVFRLPYKTYGNGVRPYHTFKREADQCLSEGVKPKIHGSWPPAPSTALEVPLLKSDTYLTSLVRHNGVKTSKEKGWVIKLFGFQTSYRQDGELVLTW